MRMTTHRVIQLSALSDKASFNRVAFYCRAIKAASLNNSGAARHFTNQAIKWEKIRARADKLLIKFS